MSQVEPKITVTNSKRVPSNRAGAAAPGGAIVPALIATLIVQVFRIAMHREPMWVWGEVILFVPLAFLLKHYLSKWIAVRDRKTANMSAIVSSQIGAAVLVGFFLIFQMLCRANSIGDANEVVAIVILQYVALYLALLGNIPGCERTSFLLNGCVVFFICCMTERFELLALAGCFAVSALWWLFGFYWCRLDAKAIDGDARTLPVRTSFVATASVLIAMAAGVACLAPLSKGTIVVDGFMPFSGGQNGDQDEFSRSGIGEGDMLTAGENATTTGAVESDQFIEDDRPSIYDMLSEQYEGPIGKKRRNRAVALGVKAKHMHDVKQSETAGKTFRTMRNADETTEADLKSKVTEALLFVEGSVPARFSIGSYQHFDGWDWEARDVADEKIAMPPIKLQTQNDKPIFSLLCPQREFLTGNRIHRLKVMRLDTNKLPSPAFLRSWHIRFVEDESFFSRNEQGDIEIAGEMIPEHTIIDMESLVPNFHDMRNLDRLNQSLAVRMATRNSAASESIYLQVPDTSAKPTLENRVATWVEDVEPGWNQVEAIVNHVRADFALKPNWDADAETEDSVGLFLEQSGGPSYMFATTCAMALRSAGYKTRLANGFVIRDTDYDRLAGQSAVTSDCVHLWPEVCLEGQYWIPVEPTPGYPTPYNTATIWQTAVAAMWAAWSWVLAHPLLSVFTVLAVSLSWFWRADLLTLGLLLWWHIVRISWPAGLLTATRQLIDARFWAAGDSRPRSKTIHAWYQRVEPGLADGFFHLWNAKNYSDTVHADSGEGLVSNCRETIEKLTLGRIRRFVSGTDQRN